jgi:hypothetical protein
LELERWNTSASSLACWVSSLCPLGFIDALQGRLTEAFVLRHAAHRVDLPLDICRKEPTVAPHTALDIDKVVGMADVTSRR